MAPESFGEVNVFSPGVRERNVSPGFAAKVGWNRRRDELWNAVVPRYADTPGVCCRDDGILVNRRGNRQAPHEVSEGGTAGHG